MPLSAGWQSHSVNRAEDALNNRMPIISCRNIYLAFAGEQVLRGVDLNIFRGDFIHLAGPNGSGKTTLLRVILGLERPDFGEIHTPFREKPPGYVPQASAIDPIFPVTVKDLIFMGIYPVAGSWLYRYKTWRHDVRKMLADFNLEQHVDKPFHQLSGGLKQKTLLARALIADPDVLVLDEPASSLDVASEMDLLERLRSLNVERGKTVIMTCHKRDGHVVPVPHRVIRIEKGRVV